MVREKVVETCVAYAAAFRMLSSLTWLGIGFGFGSSGCGCGCGCRCGLDR